MSFVQLWILTVAGPNFTDLVEVNKAVDEVVALDSLHELAMWFPMRRQKNVRMA